jgi:hypothetical protein
MGQFFVDSCSNNLAASMFVTTTLGEETKILGPSMACAKAN